MAYCHSKADKNITVCRALRNFSIRCVEVKMAYSTYIYTIPSPFKLRLADEKISW